MKRIIFLLFLCSSITLMAQQADRVQEAIANYDYETALSLISQMKPTTPLLLQKGKALRGLGMNKEALSTYQEILANDPPTPVLLSKQPNVPAHLPNTTRHLNTLSKPSISVRRISMRASNTSICFFR